MASKSWSPGFESVRQVKKKIVSQYCNSVTLSTDVVEAMEFDKMITVNGATYKAKVKHLCVSGNIFVKLKLVK